jgi:hypothetical protein
LCRPDRCPALAVTPPPPAPGDSIEAAVRALVATLRLSDSDPRAVMARIAVRLAAELDAGGGGIPFAAEVKNLVQSIAEFPREPFDQLDVLRAQVAAKRVEMMLPSASWPKNGAS